ncbi:hypothetical protein SLS58_010962 [Diplodia intermedia]|uniref:Transferase family protein n=1 Tax=Diplodia intermedia TaxID=856260 RepID=A0ABR3T2F0_9PEZI
MASDQIITTATHTVQCATASSLSKIPSPMTLGALDQQVFPIVPIAVVYIYPGTPSTTSPAIPLPALKTALSHLLDTYPHLTGRLHISPTTGTRSIDRLGAGIHLHAATCASTLSSLTASSNAHGRLTLPDLPGGGNALLAPYSPTCPADVCADATPILSVQHTAFACGAVALGLRALHAVVDSDAFFQIARDLAAVYRRLFPPATTTASMTCPLRPAADADDDIPPVDSTPLAPYLAAEMDQDGAGLTAEQRDEALRFAPAALFAVDADPDGDAAVPERYHADNKKRDAPPTPAPPPPVSGRVTRFTRAQLAALKTAAAATAGDGDDAWVSTYDALSALVWTRVHAARVELRRRGKKTQQQGGNEDEEAEPLPSRDFLTSVNHRARLALPPRYPFNAVLAPYTRLAHGALMAPDALRVAARAPDKRRVKWGFDGGYGSTMVSAWNKFDVYKGAAFVEGRPPVLVAPPFTPFSLVDGLGYYLPTERQDGGIDLYLALSAPVWGVLEEDEVWRAFRG